jgi:polysaccharide pyruvyl transferase WcaK-like protein
MEQKKIGVLHGAIKNSGDYLIYNRGMKIINEFLGELEVEFVPIERWKPFDGKYDFLILLGGPIISSTLHIQAKNIKNYLKTNNVPVICIGIGMNGKNTQEFEKFSLDEQSSTFWKMIYDSSKLFSVRDKETQLMLKQYDIDATLTGCPAFFDLDYIQKNTTENEVDSNNKIKCSINRIALTIPNLSIKTPKYFINSLFFVYYLYFKLKINNLNTNNIIIFQHPITSIPTKIFARLSSLCGLHVLDASYKGLDEIELIQNSDLHIGTRLHANIYFISTGKPSYLFNVDKRTKGFLSTIAVPSNDFTIDGIRKLVNRCMRDIKNPAYLEKETSKTKSDILKYYISMRMFLQEVRRYIQ